MHEEDINEPRWETLKYHQSYEICTAYPYPVRRKNRICKESINNCGYVQLSIASQTAMKHVLVATQWIENDDPDNKIEVDHINDNRSDNRVENLRWLSRSDNRKRRQKYARQPREGIAELPERAIPVYTYKKFRFDKFWFDPDRERLIIKSRSNFYYVNVSGTTNQTVTMSDVNGDQHTFSWPLLLRTLTAQLVL